VRRAVEAAFEGASDGKVATLDVSKNNSRILTHWFLTMLTHAHLVMEQIASYAGRLAAENPATELAQILDDHADAFRAAFSDLDALSVSPCVPPTRK
jgi:hypothetical protein